MTPFKKILVPIDFSTSSTEAVRVAADLSQRYAAEVCLVHVSDPINYALPPRYPLHLLPSQSEIRAGFEDQLSDAKKDAESAGIANAQTRYLEGIPSIEIVEFAKKHGFDLIVMGTHGRRGLQRALIGSVTEKVVRTASCAVLAVRASEATN